jgi:hypothetical protein
MQQQAAEALGFLLMLTALIAVALMVHLVVVLEKQQQTQH